MSIDSPKMLLDLPEGRLYIHPMFNSYTLMNHKDVMQKLDRLGWVVQKLTERLTILEDTLNARPRATDNETISGETGPDSGGTRQGDSGDSEGNQNNAGGCPPVDKPSSRTTEPDKVSAKTVAPKTK